MMRFFPGILQGEEEIFMANKNTKTRKPMSPAAKGAICLIVLLVLTACASWLSVMGMNLDAEGVNVLLPWVPVSSSNWVKSLPVDKSLGGGNYIEYGYTLPEDASETAVQDAANTIRARLAQLGESDAKVSVTENAIRVELREMDESRLSSLRSLSTAYGHFTFNDSNGGTILTEKDIESAAAAVKYNSTGTSYTVSLSFKVNAQGKEKLAANSVSYLTVACDGDTVSSFALVEDDTITASIGSTNSAYNTAYNVAFLKNYGSIDITLAQSDSGKVKADMGIVLTVVLIVAAAVLVCSLIYMIAVGKLTGVAGFLSVWCAVMLGLFFVATVVVPSVNMLDIGCLVAILMSIVLAVYCAVTRTDAISKQISQGNTPKQASKMGFKQVAKNLWIVHGGVLLLALIQMIFSFTKPIGYCLAAGVVASAFAMGIMRLFQGCFTLMSSKPSLFGKAK